MTGRDLGQWVGVLAVGAALAACAPEGEVRWEFAYASSALRDQASGIEAEVRLGDCGGRAVFTTWVGAGQTVAESPGRLKPGTYGFVGRARDEACNFFAEGCSVVEVPSPGSIQVLLQALPSPEPDASCVRSDVSGANGDDGTGQPDDDGGGDGDGDDDIGDGDGDIDGDGDGDGDIGDGDGDGDTDAGTDQDAGTSEPDAGPAPLSSKCQGLDDAVVACFDFNGSLLDTSGFANHATGSATFEASPLGQAMRADGNAIVVQDDDSLNVSELTIEIWFRSDSVRNLTGDPDETTLLVDKDQQYNFGYQTNGDPRGEAYRAQNANEVTSAGPVDIVPGQWFYMAYTYDGYSARLYQDGTQVARETLNIDLFQGIGGTMHIGSGSPGATRPFDGLIDALRIWNVARSNAELCAEAGRTYSANVCN